MPVVVTCSCGQRFEAIDTLAGQLVPCPTCGATLAIPESHQPADYFGVPLDELSQLESAAQSVYFAPPPQNVEPPRAVSVSRRSRAKANKRVLSILMRMFFGAFGCALLVGIVAYTMAHWDELGSGAWRTYKSPNGDYIVDMPGEPSIANEGDGRVVRVVVSGTTRYVIRNVPNENNVSLDIVVDAICNEVQGDGFRVVSKKAISVGPYQGEEIHLKSRVGGRRRWGAICLYAVGKSVYLLEIDSLSWSRYRTSYATFFKSFRPRGVE